MKLWQRWVWMSAIAMLLAGAAVAEEQPADPAKPTLWIIGDSTVRNGAFGGVGWGQVIGEYFDDQKIDVNNRAIGGRSSRTYRTEGRWADVLEKAKPGDFVMMQFGHNDGIAPDDPKRPRGSLKGTGDETQTIIHPHTQQPEEVHTFGWYMRQYVREAKYAGLVPIVCSYVPRAPRQGQAMRLELESYGLWAAQVAQQENAAFLDLYRLIARRYAEIEQQSPHAVKERFFVEGDRDYTHTRQAGAEFTAAIVADAVRQLEGEAGKLAGYLK